MLEKTSSQGPICLKSASNTEGNGSMQRVNELLQRENGTIQRKNENNTGEMEQ